MIRRPKPERFRLRRTMMFMNAQKPGLIKDAYIYGCDSIMLDLEDAVAENQKDAARFSLYHALTTIDYGNTEVIVRINGLDTPHWQEDIRVCVAGGADGIRIAKCESAQDVHTVEAAVEAAEREFGVEVGRTLLMAALESPKGILNAYEICSASDRMLGVAISGGDFRKCMQTKFTPDGVDMMVARGQMLLAARAAGIQCFDTVFTDLDDNEGFKDTPHWQEDIRVCVAGGADGIRIAKCESAQDVHTVEAAVEAAEREFGVEVGRTLLMAALESPKGILNAYEICSASDRMLGVAISGGDFRKCMQTKFTPDGVDMMVARGQMLLAARAAGIQCFDTVFTDLDDNEGFKAEVLQNKAMGFDGKSLINPKQIRLVHEVFAPTEKEVKQAEAVVRAFKEQSAAGVGVFTVNGKMIDVAFIPGAERTLRLAKACGMYEGDLV